MNMKFSGKRGFELAASTVVILIVSIVILAFSIMLIRAVVCGAEELVVTVDGQSQREIERLLHAGQGRVVVADNTQTAKTHGGPICGGGTVASATYSLGVRNTAPDTPQHFVLAIDESAKPDGADGSLITIQTIPDAGETFSIDAGAVWTQNILVVAKPGALRGQYVYTLKVYKSSVGVPSGAAYGVQQIYFIVP